MLQNYVLGSDPSTSYVTMWGHPRVVKTLLRNWVKYACILPILWDNGYSALAAMMLHVVITALAFLGYWTRVKSRLTILEVFGALYAVCIALWPAWEALRFLIPLIPLYLFYACSGVGQNWLMHRLRARRMMCGALVSVICISYACAYTTVDFGPLREGIGKSETKALFEFFKHHTRQEAVCIFIKPRAIALFAERSAAVFHKTRHDANLWHYFREIHAAYIVVGPLAALPHPSRAKALYAYDWRKIPVPHVSESSVRFIADFVDRHQDRLELVYSNPDFRVFRITNESG
jgi:hypothetical protein